MGDLPAGNVTFCFTDIEGSTQLFAKLGPRFLDLLEQHRTIVRGAVAENDGAEVKTEGDGFFLAFAGAAKAVRAAVDIQRALAAHAWPDDGTIRVRIGLHCGAADPVEGDYMSFTVHEAARVAAAAHGGQTVISEAMAEALDGWLPENVTLRDLGTHELKDISPIRIYQLCPSGLVSDFPPLRSSGANRGYVPTPSSSFLGRDDDLEAIRELLVRSRLVTIIGAGGVGKTRIAVESARAALGTRPDGVWFIDLAPVTDPAWLENAVLDALGVVRDPAGDPRRQLVGFLAERDVLLVIDNCEHLVEACSTLVDGLLRACPKVSILATSRESLGVDGEIPWRLRSLDTTAGIELFMQRSAFTAADEAARAAIEQIVERLDGIPLAIELAAARTRVLSPSQIAERLDDRFKLLTGGSRTALARQRTLEATVDWSYALLNETESALLRWLSVFTGGFGLEGAEAVGGSEALDTLESLVDKSMVSTRLLGDRIHYRLLETIRHYAWNKLVDSGEMQTARDRHLAYVTDFVDTVADGLRDERESSVADALTLENENIRGALEWSIATGDLSSAIRLVSQMWLQWAGTGHMTEGLDWIDRVLPYVRDGDTERVAQAHAGASHLRWLASEPNEAIERDARIAVDHARAREGDARWYDAWAMLRLAFTVGAGTPDAALFEEAERSARRAGDAFVLLSVLRLRADWLGRISNVEAVRQAFEEVVGVARSCGASSAVAFALDGMSTAAAECGDVDSAVAWSQDAVAAGRRGPNLWFACYSLQGLGENKGFRGDDDAAGPLLESLEISSQAGLEQTRAYTEAALGWLRLQEARPVEARARFEAAADLLAAQASNQPELLFQWGLCRLGIAESAQAAGSLVEARAILEELLALAESTTPLGWVIGMVQNALAAVDLDDGNPGSAEDRYLGALKLVDGAGQFLVREMQSKATSLRGLAAVALARGDAEGAALLSGAASHVFEPTARSGRVSVARNRSVVASARRALGDDAFTSAWNDGVRAGLDGVSP